MHKNNFPPPLRLRATTLALTVAVHIAMFAWWRLAAVPATSAPDQDTSPPIQWIRAFIRPPAPQAPAPAPQKTQPAAPRAARITPPAQAAQRPPEPAPVASESIPVDTTFDQPAPSLRERALRDVGAIDKALRKESPAHKADSPVSTPQSRLEAGFAEAYRPKVWEAPVITELSDQGQNGRRIYKVKTGLGTYCIYVDGVNTPNGIDMMQKGIQQKTGKCPRES
jgi:hypothetical protein